MSKYDRHFAFQHLLRREEIRQRIRLQQKRIDALEEAQRQARSRLYAAMNTLDRLEEEEQEASQFASGVSEEEYKHAERMLKHHLKEHGHG